LIRAGSLLWTLVFCWGVLFAFVLPVKAQEGMPENPHGNTNCYMCHSDPGLKGITVDNEPVSLFVDPDIYNQSVHAQAGLTCQSCHVEKTGYPHTESQITCLECHDENGGDVKPEAVELTVALAHPDARDVTLTHNETCRSCHSDKFEQSSDSAHARVQAGGNRDAPVCVDCHGSHDIQAPDQPREKINQTCSNCHLSVYTSYSSSVHGSAVRDGSNPDVPTCIDCHGAHHVQGPQDATFHNNSIAVCGDCHANETIMSKYGISSDVLETYLDDFHGKTVNFFRTQAPEIESNKATCFDCHGVHNIRSPEDPSSTVYPTNLQSTCQRCHTNAGITFPQAWLSHHPPSWERTPELMVANTFYSFVVPITVAGFMGYIFLDARRRISHRLRPSSRKKAQQTDKDNHGRDTSK
ncbi:MAG: cytochrome c3 family protein, partial [Anaerolineales bacterium]